MTWRMPPEWHPHERTWMAFPPNGYLTEGEADQAELARQAWANVANAIVGFEPVTMVVNPGDETAASALLSPEIQMVSLPLDDAWMRDIGPTFVIEGARLAAVDWVFNGWGAQSWASWQNDQHIGRKIAEHLGVEVLETDLVNEGGGIHVSGDGKVLLTDTVQLGEGRNPGLSRVAAEREIHGLLGTQQAVWLKRGLTRDYQEFGTQGHVDIVACFTPEGSVLYHDQQNPEHPDYEVSKEVRETLSRAGLKTLAVPAPKTLRDDVGFVDYSYINHYVVNGGVILCSFDDDNDEVAKRIIATAYPGREIVLVDARELFARGGGIHCITQQQPRVA
jgi:agmatine deiminase